MSLKQLFPAVLACAALASACGQESQETETNETSETEDEVVAVPVEVGKPSRGDIVAVYSGTAPIEAFAEADVIAKVGGEVREILVEAGFSKASAYWEGTDDDDEGNGEFTLQENAENEDAWIAYVVGIN